MLKKLVNLFSVKKWVEKFVFKTLVNKSAKHAATVILGFMGSAAFANDVQPVLTQLGITVDSTQLANGLVVVFGSLAGWILNWGIKVLDKDGDGKID